jgi:hypothetical protein
MSEPRRLREQGSELERALITSASSDAPSVRARASAARALGIDPTPGGSSGGPSGGGSAATPATMSGAKIAGFVGLAAVIALAAWQLMVLDRSDGDTGRATTAGAAPQRPSEPQAAAERSPSLEPPIERRSPEDERPSEASRALEPEGADRARRTEHPRRAVVEAPVEVDTPGNQGPAAIEAQPSTLAAEVAALDAARSAIRSGQIARALALLDEYDARFVRPELGPESDVARIEALLAGGDRAGARSLAERFLASHPTSPAAARIRRLVPEPSGESTLSER